LEAALIAGRDLMWAETYSEAPVALISENFRELWHDPRAALAKRIRPGAEGRLARSRGCGG